MSAPRTYHAFWRIVDANYPPAELRAVTLAARTSWAILEAVQSHDSHSVRAELLLRPYDQEGGNA